MSAPELDAAQRKEIACVWLARARGEAATAAVFAHLATATHALGATPDLLARLRRVADDELRHAERCRALSEWYAGQPAPAPHAEPYVEPRFGSAPREVNPLLLVVLQCCISETVATAMLQENLRLARVPEVRRLIAELLRDDLVHARIGWQHLAALPAGGEARRHVRAALPTLLRVGFQAWLGPLETAAPDRPEHGCLSPPRQQALLTAAFEELVLPGFARVGLPAAPPTLE